MIYRIENVRIADGSGNEPYWGTVRFSNVILPAEGKADRVIDGQGLLLTPGFIDVHGHSDMSALASPECFTKISQGFTTEISGNCGLSPFPLTAKNKAHLEELYRIYNVPMTWRSFSGYGRRIAKTKMRLAPLCGHNTLRAAVAGYGTKTLSPSQLDKMCRMLDDTLTAGALGMSSGLLYTPGCYSDRDELVHLMAILAKHDKIYTTHLRSEGKELLESIGETIECARSAGLKKIHISHFKTAQQANWHKLDKALELFAEAEKSGISITFDRYPYLESMTQLSVIAEGRFGMVDDSELMRLLNEPGAETELESLIHREWRNVRLVTTSLADFAGFSGMTFDRIGEELGRNPASIAVSLLRRDACNTMAAFRGMCEENLRRIVTDKRCFCGTDESARPEDYRIGRSHPRGAGSLPIFWQILKESGISTGESVRRLTSAPAERFGLTDRGRISPGKLPDLLLIDESKLSSNADFTNPHTPSGGITLIDNLVRKTM